MAKAQTPKSDEQEIGRGGLDLAKVASPRS